MVSPAQISIQAPQTAIWVARRPNMTCQKGASCGISFRIATSASLSPLLKSKIQKALSAVPVQPGEILGREDLNNLIRKYPAVERQHFKLWLASTTVLMRKTGIS